MDHDELSHTGGFESNHVGLSFRTAEPPSRPWVQVNSGSRALSVERDRSHGKEFELAELWLRLGTREWQVRDTFATACRLYAIVDKADFPARHGRGDAGLSMIEELLVGQSSKAVAIDRQVSCSTVAQTIRNRLREMGLSCKVRAMPLILALAARAACGHATHTVLGRIAPLPEDSVGRWVVSVAHPDFRFPAPLSGAERSVLLHALDGKTYVEIAAARGTALRTVANQLAAVFRKLGVSGYGETLALLLSGSLGEETEPPAPVPAPRETFRWRAAPPPPALPPPD